MRLDRYRVRALQLVAVWAYGVTQPVLSLVDGNPDLVVGRGASRLDVLGVVLVIAIVPPLLAVGYAWLASRFAPWIGDAVYLFLVGLFLVPIGLQVAKAIEPSAFVVVLLVAALCTAGLALYVRFRAVRLFVGFSIVLPALGLVWFWQGIPSLTGDARAADVVVRSPHPVVVLLVDELPVSSLLTRSGQVDAARYPAFGRLAQDAVWYRNATTVYDETAWAVPALLSGTIPPESARPTAADHPENLFTLLGGTYEPHVHETATRLCPPSVCRNDDSESATGRLRSLLDDIRRTYVTRVVPESVSSAFQVVDFDTVLEEAADATLADFEALLAQVRPQTEAPPLYFSHLFLPHAPWRFLPSGVTYPFRGTDGWDGTTDFWGNDPRLVLQGRQRHLLQLVYTDALVGRLLSKLEEVGLYERALIVVAADHGVSFVPGAARRRPVTEENVADLANVPLFVKYPGRRDGRIDDRGASVIDVLPTIADVLGVSLPWQLDGRSLLTDGSDRAEVVVRQSGGDPVEVPLTVVEAQRAETVRRQSAAFGEGQDSLYRVGRYEHLVGRRVDSGGSQDGDSRARLDQPSVYAAVDKSSGHVPARVSGTIEGRTLPARTELAVVVNGRVAGLAIVFDDYGRQRFSALVPESSFEDGANEVEVFVISTSGSEFTLVRL